MSDGWEDVTDPGEIRKVLGAGAGGGGLSSYEEKSREEQMGSLGQSRNYLSSLLRAEQLNRTIPTGRFAARVNEGVQEFPSEWQNGDISNYQEFGGIQQSILKPSIALTGVGNASSKEMDTPAELMMNLRVVPGPEKERGANTALVNRLGQLAMEQRARILMAQKWRQLYGSTHAPNKAGETMEEAWGRYRQSDAGKRVFRPLTQRLDEAAARRQATAKPKRGWGIVKVFD